jgi:hypothetical protein
LHLFAADDLCGFFAGKSLLVRSGSHEAS